ncbi:MAG: glycosyltransferase family 1 protein [Burkholderiaceae bacterium]
MTTALREAPPTTNPSSAPGNAASAWRGLLIDDSLSLVNRTGAHFIAKDLVAHFRETALVRRWRLFGADMPQGLARKLLARAMLLEMRWLGSRPGLRWPERARCRRLFLDPLYVMRAELDPGDMVLCHDIGPLSHTALYLPETVRWYEAAYARVAERRPGLVFVSETSKAAFTARFGNDFRFLHSIPLYVRSESAGGPDEPVPGITAPFFLTVGALEHRKNHLATITAFERSGLADAGVTLVLCGSRGDATEQVQQRVASARGVLLPGYVSDAQLRWLYRNAIAFVLPSLLEGFGMPALEAAQHGLIPIISGDSALNEAVGGLGLPIDEHDPDSIASAMHSVRQLAAPERAAWQQRLREHARGATREHFLQQWDRLISTELERTTA